MLQAEHPEIGVLVLTGDVRRQQRDEIVRRFQEDATSSVLICTLGVGGVGLNLTAASHVVHFDRCWNPAKEAQATDRAHRIGQKSTVMVHRLLAQGTFEERLHRELARKAALASEVIPEDMSRLITDYPLDELRHLFTLQSERDGTEQCEDRTVGL